MPHPYADVRPLPSPRLYRTVFLGLSLLLGLMETISNCDAEEAPILPDNRRSIPVVSLYADDLEVTIKASDRDRAMIIQSGNLKSTLPYPEGCGNVREMVATWWARDGIAIALECEGKDKGIEYYWITFYFPFKIEDKQEVVLFRTHERFLETKEDYDLASIRNTGGDSIYIILTRQTRTGGVKGDTLHTTVYVNNCPRGPGWGALKSTQIKVD